MMLMREFLHIMWMCLVLLLCWHVNGISPAEIGYGYRVSSVKASNNGLIALLELKQHSSLNGPDVEQLQLNVSYYSSGYLHVHITSTGTSNARWEIPQFLIPQEPARKNNVNMLEKTLSFSYTEDPFTFSVVRNSTGEVLFDTTFGNMVFKDQYLELSTFLPDTAALYGLGESTRAEGFQLCSGQTYTLWASDITASTTDVDLYGAHPFYIDVREGGISHGVLLLNSNGMDIIYVGNSLTYKVVGGVFDFYFFPGPEPLTVVQQYTEVIGRPAPMPYWSLGFHQCRYGYESVEDLEFVVANYRAAHIPLEVIWNDIDYMDVYKDFTFDPINYPVAKMQAFVADLHGNGQKYVLILDPGISTADNYSTFQRGMELDIFIKRTGIPYLAQVWPGPVYFTDFLHPNIDSFWGAEIASFHGLVPFDGLWIDMNEASNFCSGTVCIYPTNSTCTASLNQAYCCLVCNSENSTMWDDPPYAINAGGVHRGLGTKTIATSASHANGFLLYNTHNLYGFSEAIATHRALKNVTGKRPFILSRSTFPGTGAYAAHWTGDNSATWEDLRYSIPGVLNSGIFGMPMVGADICGFLEDTDEELCNRWIQLGAFYPFSRNHADIGSSRQELYLWDSVIHSAKRALGLRYMLLPYLYTLMQEAHEIGAPIARPLFFTFPEDANTSSISSQFLLGRGLLVSPVLEAGADSVTAYFPKGTWYSLHDDFQGVVNSNGSYHVLPAPWDTINVHMYEGLIIPMQKAAMTTGEVRKSPITLLIALAHEEPSSLEEPILSAKGEIYVDDGEGMEMILKEGKSTKVTFMTKARIGYIEVLSQVGAPDYALKEGLVVDKVIILGLRSLLQPVVEVNGALSACKVDVNAHVLTADGLNLPLASDFTMTVHLSGWQVA